MAEQTITAPKNTAPKITIPTTAPLDAVRRTEADPLAYRRSPGADLTELMATRSRSTVHLQEVPFPTQLALRATSEAARQALGHALGAPLPDRVGAVTSGTRGHGGPVHVLWLAPDEWLAVLDDEAVTGESGRQLVEAGGEALAGHRGQVVDVSANRATLELSGPNARAVLDKTIQLDLHPREFPVGRAVATLLESVPVIVWRTGEHTWRILPRASFTEYVVRWLLDGMREFA